VHDTVIQRAHGLRFYFKGGGDLVALQRGSERVYTVHIPIFSDVVAATISSLVAELAEDIAKEIEVKKIGNVEWFLFDTKTKKILCKDSFMDFIPYHSIRKALFVVENEDGTNEKYFRYMPDSSNYALIQLMCTIVAKRELMLPISEVASDWSLTGKQLLSYLVSERFYMKVDFSSIYGCWDAMKLVFNKNRKYPIPVNLDTMNVDRAKKLAVDAHYGDVDDDYPDFSSPPPSIGNVKTLLSDVLLIGVDAFCKNSTGYIDVEIDWMRETFKSVTIDCVSGICFVELNRGIEISLEQLKDDLQADNLQILSDLTDIIPTGDQ